MVFEKGLILFFTSQDQTLIKKAMKGDQRSWNKLVQRHEKMVLGYALRMTGNQADAMDLMQETFVSVCRSLPLFEGKSSVKTWIMSLAHYRCIDFYRRTKPMTTVEDIDTLETTGNGRLDDDLHAHGPSHDYEQRRAKLELLEHLAGLPFEQKLIIELKVFQQLTFEQIAEQLGQSSSTIKSKFYSGLNKLKSMIESRENAA